MSEALLTPDDAAFRTCYLPKKTVILSIDVETDFGSGRTEALSQLERLLELVETLGIPLTAFVEGQFFENKTDIIRLLSDYKVNLQLHCYDHSTKGDTPDLLRRGVAAYANFLGQLPNGYRAHTYGLGPALYHALAEEGVKWDSSILPAFAQGGNFDSRYRNGDYLIFENNLIEFPVATWNRFPFPLNHSYRQLMGRPTEAVLRRIFGPQNLVFYNMHMVDLVYSNSLATSNLPLIVKLLYKYMWGTNRTDTFSSLKNIVEYLQSLGYAFQYADEVYRELADQPAEG